MTLFFCYNRLRSSYTRLTSWVFDTKRFVKKRKSFKRKSSKKNEIKDKNTINTPLTPSISVSNCDETNNNDSNNINQLFNLIIEGNCLSLESKSEHQLIVMYLMPPNDTTDNDCLVFSYPKHNNQNHKMPVLLKLKGMFVTLSQVVSQITNQFINLSSIAVNHENKEQIYTIGFMHEFSSLLAIALPKHQFTDIEVETMVQTISRVIKFVYNSLDSGFKNESNHQSLTKLFSTIEYLLTEETQYSITDSIFVNTIKRLLIDDSLAINISDSLSEYEAMDWLSDDSSIDIQQQSLTQFIVIGSCIIFKGFLITSHLPANYLKEVYGLLSTKGLLSLHKKQSIRLVYWSEVFPISQRRNESNDYIENEGVKYYMAIVGIEHLIHCTLIEMPFISLEETPIKANEIIINESIRLIKSYFTKSGILDEIEHCFEMQEQAFSHFFGKKNERKRHKSLSSLKDLFSLTSSPSTSKQQIYHSTSSLLSLDESIVSGSNKSYSSPSLQHSILSQNSSSATSLSHPNSKDINPSICCPNNCIYLQQNLQLPENLICYLDIEDGLEVFAGPLLQCPKEVCDQVFKKFAECCYDISKKLRNLKNGIQEFGKTFEIRFPSNFLSPNKTKLKKSDFENCLFNVIGRSESQINEFYACFKLNSSALMPIDIDFNDLVYKLRLQRRLL
jgi:hypothetical protein